MRGLKSPRLQAAVSMIPDTSSPIYDLFCDHGKLGEHFYGKREVYFNDKRDHLLDSLKERLDCSTDFLCYGDAQDLTFKPSSVVLMLGVGGLTIIDCFKKWAREVPKNFKEGQTFIVSPHYHLIEFSDLLVEMQAECTERIFTMDSGRGYEIFKVVFSKNEVADFELFDSNFWGQQILRTPEALHYLNSRLKFTDSYQGVNPSVFYYRDQLREFLRGK